MDPYEEADLRSRQAAQSRIERQVDEQNSLFAIPTLAPELIVGVLDTAGAIGEMLAGSGARRSPLMLTEREPGIKLRGDNWHTRLGQRKHAEFRDTMRQRASGWEAEKMVTTPEGNFRPDAMTPVRNEGKRFNLDLKPDTPSGRRRGAQTAKRYTKATGNRTRIIYYDPNS